MRILILISFSFLLAVAVLSVSLLQQTALANSENTLVSSIEVEQFSELDWRDVLKERFPLVAKEIVIADHASDGVMSRTFNGQGRCSQVCPTMIEIAKAHCSSVGRCWCDEQGSQTTAHVVCG